MLVNIYPLVCSISCAKKPSCDWQWRSMSLDSFTLVLKSLFQPFSLSLCAFLFISAILLSCQCPLLRPLTSLDLSKLPWCPTIGQNDLWPLRICELQPLTSGKVEPSHLNWRMAMCANTHTHTWKFKHARKQESTSMHEQISEYTHTHNPNEWGGKGGRGGRRISAIIDTPQKRTLLPL